MHFRVPYIWHLFRNTPLRGCEAVERQLDSPRRRRHPPSGQSWASPGFYIVIDAPAVIPKLPRSRRLYVTYTDH